MPPDGMVGPALYVSDPAKSRAFYVDGLGMTLRASFGPKDKPDMIVGFGRSMFDAGIMLLTDKEAAAPRPIQHVHGFDRIALRVADLRAINVRLQAAGFAPGNIQVVHGAVQMMMVTDPDGYRIEMIDSKPAPRAR
jgi:catechol 2,3-dioxygenase-like lactoylglutathione lyase family enzyme